MTTTKRQLAFYAETDVDLYLSLLGSGTKTKVLNEAIRARMAQDAKVNLNDGKRPITFADLSETDQKEVHSNLIREELSLNDVDDQIWEIVRETASNSWKENTCRYLALHEAKFQEPFRIKRLRSEQEKEASLQPVRRIEPMTNLETAVRNLKTEFDVAELANQIMAETTGEKQVANYDRFREENELLLLQVILAIASKSDSDQPILPLLIQLLNTRTTYPGEQANTDLAQRLWTKFDQSTRRQQRADIFAFLNMRIRKYERSG